MKTKLIDPKLYAQGLDCMADMATLRDTVAKAGEMGWAVELSTSGSLYSLKITDKKTGEEIGSIRKRKFFDGIRELPKCL